MLQRLAGLDVVLLLQAAGVEVTSRGMQRALLALHAAVAVAPESLAAAMGRTPAPDATPALQVHGSFLAAAVRMGHSLLMSVPLQLIKA
jgi:hypothetical protein